MLNSDVVIPIKPWHKKDALSDAGLDQMHVLTSEHARGQFIWDFRSIIVSDWHLSSVFIVVVQMSDDSWGFVFINVYWYSCWCYYCNLYYCWYCFQGLWWSRWVMRTIVIGSHWSRFSWAEKPWSRGCRSRRWCYHVITPLPLPPLLLPHLPPPSLLHLLFLPILLLLLHFSFTPLFLPLLPCMEKYTFFSLPFKP